MQAEQAATYVPDQPYPGIESYRYVDRAIFFGRDSEIQKLWRYVTMYRAVLLYGESGCGKSSLVNAGFIPLALADGYAPERIRLQPRRGGEIVVERIATAEQPHAPFIPSIFADELSGARQLVLPINAFRQRVVEAAAERRPVLIFDQFEELVTLIEQPSDGSSLAETRAVQEQVLEVLLDLIRDPWLPVKLLFSFREDYLAKLSRLFSAYPDLRDQFVRLAAPRAADLPTIIQGPFERLPGAFKHPLSPALTARLVQALTREGEQQDLSLSALQIVCLRLWLAHDPEGLFAEKGIQGLLGDYVADAIAGLPLEQRDLAAALLSHLVTAASTRNIVSREDLVRQVLAEEPSAEEAVLETLQELERDAKLIRGERRHDLYVFEIVSEFLVPGIARQKELRQVRRERAEAERRAEVQRQLMVQRVRQGLQRLGLFASTVVIIALGALTMFALSQRMQAEFQRDQAQFQRGQAEQREEEARQLAIDANARRTEAEQARNEADRLRGEAEAALERARTAEAQVAYLVSAILRGHTGAVYSAAFSQDGTRIATAGEDQTAKLWDRASGEVVQELSSPGAGRVYSVAYSPTGELVATAHQNGTVRTWRPGTSGPPTVLTPAGGTPSQTMWSVAFSPSGELVAATSADQSVHVWDLRTGADHVLSGHRGLVTSAAFADEDHLVSSSDDRTARIWTLSTDTFVEITGHAGEVTSAAFDPNGSLVVTSSADGKTRIWDATSLDLITELPSQSQPWGRATSASFSPDGRQVVTTYDDGIARLWDWQATAPPTELRGHTDRVYSAAFSRDGRRVVTASRDLTARVWEPSSTNQAIAEAFGTSSGDTTKFDSSPTSSSTSLQAGRDALTRGDLTQAISQCSNAITANPNDAQAYLCRGLAYDRLDTDEGNRQAIADYSDAVRLDPSLDIAYLERGLLLANVFNDCERARPDLERYLQNSGGSLAGVARATLDRCRS